MTLDPGIKSSKFGNRNENDVKTVILAGGLGTRLSEETEIKPKPMVEIGGRPILWHIMKHFAFYGLCDFSIALGYKGEEIKRFFIDYLDLSGSMTVSLAQGKVERHDAHDENWCVHLADTGQDTMTGGRLGRLREHLTQTFVMTYGDGLSDVPINELVAFHKAHGKLATVTAVRPPARFGGLIFDGDRVAEFTEKPQSGEGWINGGFFVLEPQVLDYIDGDGCFWEREPMERLSQDGQLMAFRHPGFWQCMDTLRDKRLLEEMWQSGHAPWKVWN
jgi:glucose-1-phosphate cytidylyltransferase